MIQKLKNWLIKKLGGITQEEAAKAKRKEWIDVGLASKVTMLPIELNVKKYNCMFAPRDAMESYAKHELFERIKPYIRTEIDPCMEAITAKIMILPYTEADHDT